MDGIRQGTAADHPVLMERMLAAFRTVKPGHPPFPVFLPDLMTGDIGERMENWLVRESNGQIAAALQLVPRKLVAAGEVRLDAVGLGQLFCHPLFRNRGHMGELLEAAIGRMTASGAAVSWLSSGDRLRYLRFGWEQAGTARMTQLSRRFLDGGAPAVSPFDFKNIRARSGEPGSDWAGAPAPPPAAPGSVLDFWQPRPYTGGAADIARMWQAYSAVPYRCERTEAEFALVLRRPDIHVWICDDPKDGFAYLVHDTRRNRVAEYAGAAAALERIVRFLLAAGGAAEPMAVLPPVANKTTLEQVFLRHTESVRVEPLGMYRILSLRNTLEAYRNLLARRLSGWRGEFRLRNADGGETVCLAGTGDGLWIKTDRTGGPADIALSRTGLARLLFGPFPPSLGDAVLDGEFVRRAFPLPVHWPPLSKV